jgi:hypothetical protein
MRAKMKLAIIGVTMLVICLVWYWPPTRKYNLGMKMEEAQALMSKPYPVNHAAISYKGGPSQEEMNNDPIYMIDVKNQGVILYFNHYRKLIKITGIP